MALKRINKQAAQFGRAGMLGFGGVGIICVTQILTLQERDQPLKLALLCFCIAIPLLCASGLMHETLLNYDKIEEKVQQLALAPGGIGALVGVIGLVAVFWHFSWVYGFLFFMATAAGTAL